MYQIMTPFYFTKYKAELSLNATVEPISVENCVISRNLAHAKNNADGLLPSYPSVSFASKYVTPKCSCIFTYCVYNTLESTLKTIQQHTNKVSGVYHFSCRHTVGCYNCARWYFEWKVIYLDAL